MTYLDDIAYEIFAEDGSCDSRREKKIGHHGRVGFLPGMIQAGRGKNWSPHALAAAAPYSLMFDIGHLTQQNCLTFRARAGLDMTSDPSAETTLMVFADQTLVSVLPRIRHSAPLRTVEAYIPRHTRYLILKANHNATFAGSMREFTTWLDPRLEAGIPTAFHTYLGEIDVNIPDKWEGPHSCDTCLFTATTPGYTKWTDNMLGSLWQNGQVRDSSLVLFGSGASNASEDSQMRGIAEKYNGLYISCRLGHQENITSKLATTSVPHLINANRYLALDGDMVILRSLRPLLHVIDVMPDRSIGCCREWNLSPSDTLEHHLTSQEYVYFGEKDDADKMGMTQEERDCRMIANMGIYGGKKGGLLGMDSLMRSMLPEAAEWEASKLPAITWREQAIMNRACALLGMYEFDSSYNVQLLSANAVEKAISDTKILYIEDKPVNILHFNGAPGKAKHPEYHQRFIDIAHQTHFAPFTKFGE